MESLKLFWGIFFLKDALGGSLLDFDEGFKVSTYLPNTTRVNFNELMALIYVVIAS
jgi:hypothetical protein